MGQIYVTPKTRNSLAIRALPISGVTRKWHFLNYTRAGLTPHLLLHSYKNVSFLMISVFSLMPSSSPTLGFLLHDVARLLRKRFEQYARGLGLTRSQWQVLAFLAPNEGIHQAGLADILDVEAITLTRILDKLEACSMIERRAHPTDRRIWLLYLTEKAHPMLAQMRVLGERTRAEALQGIPDAACELLMQSLAAMRENLVLACDQPVQGREGVFMTVNEASNV